MLGSLARALAVLLLVSPSAGYVRPPMATIRHRPIPAAPLRTHHLQLCDAVPDSEPEGLEVEALSPSPLGKAKAWIKKWATFDKDKIAALGFDAFFTYGFVSNVNAGLTIALAWGTFTKSSGLSPLVPGQWSKFLAVYVGIYATLGTVLRPFRMALAVGLTPGFTRLVKALMASLPFYESRPKLNRTLAMIVVSFFGNIGVTCGIVALGVWVSSLVTGVPVAPPGWRLFPGRA